MLRPLKDCILCKIRNDKISLQYSLEHLWAEVKGKNKKSPYFIGIVYQPSSENAKKIEWIENNDAVYLRKYDDPKKKRYN